MQTLRFYALERSKLQFAPSRRAQKTQLATSFPFNKDFLIMAQFNTQFDMHFNQIVATEERYVEVCAGPGTRKTAALVARLGYLLDNSVPLGECLILTFSNSSMGVVRERFHNEATTTARSTAIAEATVLTCHQFCLRLLKAATPSEGLEVLDEPSALIRLSQAVTLASKRCANARLWPDASDTVRTQYLTDLRVLPKMLPQVLRLIEYARAGRINVQGVFESGRFPELAAYAVVLVAVRQCYKEAKRRHGQIDFADMLFRAPALLRRKSLSTVPYTRILVDEYQDCSVAQVRVLGALAKLPGRSIMVFGDKDQAVFGFSGAHYTPLRTVLPDAVTMRLPKSLRLTAETAALASSVALHGPEDQIETVRSGKKPLLVCSKTMRAQIPKIVQAIINRIESGTSPQRIAVMARTKAQLRPVEQALLAHGIKVDRKNMTQDSAKAIPVLQLVNKLERWNITSGADAHALLKSFVLHHDLPTTPAHMKLAVTTLRHASRTRSLEGRFHVCAKVYLSLRGGANVHKELRNDINRWTPLCRGKDSASDMHKFIQRLNPIAVTTSTIHAAKGGDWEHVFILGATEGLLPYFHAARCQTAHSEERRLAYVAVTRASQSVTLFHTPTHHARSRQKFTEVSGFFTDAIAQGLLRVE